MALVRHVEVVESELGLVPVLNGQLIVVTDKREWYYDKGNERIPVADIIPLESEAERVGLIAPLNKLYFVKESVRLYYYFGEWIELSGLNGKDGMPGLVISEDEPEPSDGILPVWIKPSDKDISTALLDTIKVVVDEAIEDGSLTGAPGLVISEDEPEPVSDTLPVWIKPTGENQTLTEIVKEIIDDMIREAVLDSWEGMY